MIWFRFVVVLVLVPTLSVSGCMGPGDLAGDDCEAWDLVHDGVGFLGLRAQSGGGVADAPGVVPDPVLTAWVLLAVRLAERTGQMGAFDGRVHSDWLRDQLPGMMQEGAGEGSVANNVSLVRAALQAWGHMTEGVAVEDPEHPEVRTLAEAWDARFQWQDEQTGVYGDTLQEHVLGALMARIHMPVWGDRERLDAMGRALEGLMEEHDGEPFEEDTWFAGYARAVLGPEPVGPALALRAEEVLEQRQDPDGGVRAFDGAQRADAATTAAALLGWQAAGLKLDDPEVAGAVDWLCGLQDEAGSVPYTAEKRMLRVQTTAHLVVALSLFLEPIPWPEQRPM